MKTETTKSVRLSATPSALRVAQYPDLSTRIQGGYPITVDGVFQGLDWADLPLVEVDEKGKEL